LGLPEEERRGGHGHLSGVCPSCVCHGIFSVHVPVRGEKELVPVRGEKELREREDVWGGVSERTTEQEVVVLPPAC
jgi:hypothetical protein